MEISTIRTGEVMLDILHPVTDEPLGITVPLRPLDDPIMRRLSRKLNDEKITLGKKGKVFDAKKMEENFRLIVFTAMSGWDWKGDATFHGEKPAFNETMVYKVFDELPWFQSQLEDKLGEIRSFFPV
jgi:hypothetical protein